MSKKKAVCSLETSGGHYTVTRSLIPEEQSLQAPLRQVPNSRKAPFRFITSVRHSAGNQLSSQYKAFRETEFCKLLLKPV